MPKANAQRRATTAAERGARVRERLLAAAAELVPEVGWTAVSTRLLAERAGVAPGLVHYHFRSVQALLREATVGAMRSVLDASAPALYQAPELDAGLDALLGALDAYTGDDPTSLLFVETYLAATRDEQLREELTGLLAAFRRDLARWLAERGQERPEETAAVLAAAVDGALLHRVLDPGLTAARVAPVLRRVLTPARGRRRTKSRTTTRGT